MKVAMHKIVSMGLLGLVALTSSGVAMAQDANREKAKQHFFKANTLFKAGKYPDAALEYQKTIELVPTLANPHKNLARCYLAMKQDSLLPDIGYHLMRYLQLKEDASDASAIEKELRKVLVALGRSGKPGKELAELSALLEQQGTEAAEEEKWGVAVRRFEQLKDLNPDKPEYLASLGESYLGALQCDEAKRTYEAYLLVRPEEKDKLGLAALVSECREEAKTAGKGTGIPGKLVIIANVTGAAVLIDGKRVGNTPLDGPLKLPPGDHQLALFKEGYETSTRKVSIASGKSVQLKIEMVKFDMDEDEGDVKGGGAAPPPSTASARGAIVVSPTLGVATAFGGGTGTMVGPSVGVTVGYELMPGLSLGLQLGFHYLSAGLQKAAPFEDATVNSNTVPVLAVASYAKPFGRVEALVGVGLGSMFVDTKVTADDGAEASAVGGILALDAFMGARYPLGPGSLLGTVGYLAHPLNQVDLTYYEAPLLTDVHYGGLRVGLGYSFSM